MSLKITLRPGERIFVSGAVLRNGPTRSQFFIENKVPLLREKEIMLEGEVDTIAKQVYFLLQAMYMENEPGERMAKMIREFKRLTNTIVDAAPSSAPIVLELHQRLLADDLYKALRACRKLIDFERERLEHFRNTIAGDQDAAAPDGPRHPTDAAVGMPAAKSAGGHKPPQA